MIIETKPIKELNIVLISNTDEVIEKVKEAVAGIDKNLVSGCQLWRCAEASQTKAISAQERAKTDVVLVCLYDYDTDLVLGDIGVLLNVFSETPIITLTRSADHILALTAIEQGAASNVTDDDLHNNASRLKSVIEYSLARYKNARTGKLYLKEALQYLRKQNKQKLRSAKSVSSMALKNEQSSSSNALRQEKEHSAEDLRQEQGKSSAALKQEKKRSARAVNSEKKRSEAAINKEHEKNAQAAEEKESIIQWLCGTYMYKDSPPSEK